MGRSTVYYDRTGSVTVALGGIMCDRFICPRCGGWMECTDMHLGTYACDTCDAEYNILSDTWAQTEVEDERSISD